MSTFDQPPRPQTEPRKLEQCLEGILLDQEGEFAQYRGLTVSLREEIAANERDEFDYKEKHANSIRALRAIILEVYFQNNEAFNPDILDVLSELQKFEQEVFTDPMTKVGNRRMLQMTLARETTKYSEKSRADEHRRRTEVVRQPFAVLLIDIDYFGRLNEQLGHDKADQVLVEMCRLCQGLLRPSDIMCRYGGEEFCIVLPQTNIAGAEAIAERLRSGIEGEGSITVSIGIASADQYEELEAVAPDDLSRGLMARADKAVYAAKNSGRNNVKLYDATMAQQESGACIAAAEPAEQEVEFTKDTAIGILAERAKATGNALEKRIIDLMLENKESLNSNQAIFFLKHLDQLADDPGMDALTGLPLRGRFDLALQNLLLESRRNGRKASVGFIDIDFFKAINDEFGHKAGDAVLIAAGSLFQELARETDIVCRRSPGGEEFLWLMPGTSLQDACAAASRMRRGIQARLLEKYNEIRTSMGLADDKYDIAKQRPELTISIGISSFSPKIETNGQKYTDYTVPNDAKPRLEREADAALLYAKGGGYAVDDGKKHPTKEEITAASGTEKGELITMVLESGVERNQVAYLDPTTRQPVIYYEDKETV